MSVFFCIFAREMYKLSIMRKLLFILTAVFVFASTQAQEQEHIRYVGGDISMLPQYEKHSSGYKDANNQKISNLITWLRNDCGWNTFRVRLFVNPNPDFGTAHYKEDNKPLPKDYAIIQDLAYVTALGKRIKDAGAYFMLDFHYSDFWVDAGKILPPDAWAGANDAAMADSVSNYTHRVLRTLKAAGATPDLVQVGNEIMYGVCGRKVHPYDYSGDNWTGYIGILQAGCNAVREECPNAQIIIHTDRPCNKEYNNYYYGKLVQNNVDFDVIGLSYYPFWHADYTPTAASTAQQTLYPLTSAIKYLGTQFPDKRVQIVETAYNFQYWPNKGVNYDTRKRWECSVAGQYQYIQDLVDVLKPLTNLDGISYWFPEDAGNGDYVDWNTKSRLIEESWSNRGFWDEKATTSGHALNSRAPHYMRNFYRNAEGVETVSSNEMTRSRKVLKDGQFLIERNGETYTFTGQKMQ